MVKLQEMNGQYHINLPKALVKAQKWKKGDEFSFVPSENGEVVMARVKAYV